MKFQTVKDLISYLECFNPNAEILTDMGFSWSKIGVVEGIDARQTTDILYVYGEYNPYYNENKNYYIIKDFLVNTFFDEYEDFVQCYLDFKDEEGNPAVEYYLKHKNYWTFQKTDDVSYKIFNELKKFCEEEGFLKEYYSLTLFVVPEMFD